MAAWHGQHKTQPARFVQGNDIANAAPESRPMGVRGVVTAMHTKLNGNRVIRLQADDGADVNVIVGPTVAAVLPHVNDRIEVVGLQAASGMLTVEHREDLKLLTPHISHQLDPETGVVGSAYEDMDARVQIIRQRHSGSLLVGLYDPFDGHFKGQADVPATVAADVRNGAEYTFAGYFRHDRRYMVTGILP